MMERENNLESRVSSIDILKGIGIISVIIGHVLNTDNFYLNFVEYARIFVYLYH